MNLLLYLEQFATWIVGPLHSRPPHWATGPSHKRDRQLHLLTKPSPSSWLQDCHGAHWPKPPSCVRFLTSREDFREAPSQCDIGLRCSDLVYVCACVSYWALSDVLGPLVHVGAPLEGGAQILLVVPATVWVPSMQALASMKIKICSVAG